MCVYVCVWQRFLVKYSFNSPLSVTSHHLNSVSKASFLVPFPFLLTSTTTFLFSALLWTPTPNSLITLLWGDVPSFFIFFLPSPSLHPSLTLSGCHCVRIYLELNYSLENWRAIKETGTMSGPCVCVCVCMRTCLIECVDARMLSCVCECVRERESEYRSKLEERDYIETRGNRTRSPAALLTA